MNTPNLKKGLEGVRLALILTYFLNFESALIAQNLSNPQASADAQKMYEFLSNYQISNEYCLILGQNLGWSMEEFDLLVNDLQTETGKWPGIIGGQLRFAPDEIDYDGFFELLVEWQETGGLVELSTLFNNPFTGGDIWDVSMTDIGSLLPGSAAFNNWRTELDFYATFLKKLEEAGVIVLWRPLMEMNGDWFWYGFHGDENPQNFIDLYRDLYEYYTQTWKLNNLIWVFCSNVAYEGIPAVDHYYPGDDVVDMVGFDMYLTDLANPDEQYKSMIALGKPFSIPEFGPSLNEMDGSHDYANYVEIMRRDFPQARYTLAWHNWPDHAASWNTNQNYVQAFNLDCILDRDQIPNLFTTSRLELASTAANQIYPNPVAGNFPLTIESEIPIEDIWRIDVAGNSRKIEFKAIGENQIKLIDVSQLSGVYFFRIKTSIGWSTEKIVAF